MSNLFQYSDAHRNYFTHHGQKVDYRKNQLMVWPSDDSSWVYFLDTGLVKVACLYDDGSESILGYFDAGLSFAQSGSYFQYNGGAALEYTPIEPCTVYRVSRDQFFTQLARDQAFNQDYLTMVLRNQLLLIDRVIYLGESKLSKRCVRWLLFMAKYFGTRDGKACLIAIPLTQDTVASLLNITRESAGKCLRPLIKDGYIRMEKKRIAITNIHKLQGLL